MGDWETARHLFRKKNTLFNVPWAYSKKILKWKISVEYLEDSFSGKLSLATRWGCDAAVISLKSDSKLVCEHNFPLNIVKHASCLCALSEIICSNLRHQLLHKLKHTTYLSHSTKHMLCLTWRFMCMLQHPIWW